MSNKTIARIDQIEGIHVESPSWEHHLLDDLIGESVRTAISLRHARVIDTVESRSLNQRALRLAALSALQTVNALLSAVQASCTRANPPEDIEMVTDSSGRLIYRCYHDPDHKWDLAGNPIP